MKKFFILLLVSFVIGSGAASAKSVTVKKGDSIWKIAQRYKADFQNVLSLNKHHIDPDLIHPGDSVILPDGSAGTKTDVKSSDESGTKQAPSNAITSQAEAVLLLVNQEREKRNISPLELSENLTNIATVKAQEMVDRNYFSHTSPQYGTPFEMLKKFGVSYKSAGENIAAGQQTAKDVMDAWMQSSGHRENILNANYTDLGVGYVVGGSYKVYWTQLFIQK